ncbi:MAG: DUF302 domain-containing protein [Bacteroidales bacterium]|nr:DUF302 domain-containing protein [Bacteroidales bacterium]
MKKIILFSLGSFVLGVFICLMLIYQIAPKMMLLENESKFAFEETVNQFEASIKNHNWSMIKVHDLQKSMEKHGHIVKNVKVFEFCHPDLAKRILEADDDRIVSSMMPCRIAIYEKNDGKTYISRMNSGMMSKMMSSLVQDVMGTATQQSEDIMNVIIK